MTNNAFSDISQLCMDSSIWTNRATGGSEYGKCNIQSPDSFNNHIFRIFAAGKEFGGVQQRSSHGYNQSWDSRSCQCADHPI